MMQKVNLIEEPHWIKAGPASNDFIPRQSIDCRDGEYVSAQDDGIQVCKPCPVGMSAIKTSAPRETSSSEKYVRSVHLSKELRCQISRNIQEELCIVFVFLCNVLDASSSSNLLQCLLSDALAPAM